MQPRLSTGQRRERLQQAPGVGVARIVEDILRRAELHDLPCVHDGHTIRHARHSAEVVRDENRCRAELLLNFAQQIENLGLNGHIQRGRRLVGKQDRRVARQRNGQHDALAHAAGKVVRIQATPLLRPVDADKAHQLEHALHQSRATQAGRMNMDSGRQLRADGHAGVQRSHRVLKYHGKQ